MSKIDLLKEQIAQKTVYIEQMKQEQQQRAEQLKNKYEAELNGIDTKIGAIVEQRRAVYEQKQALEKEAAKALEAARMETFKAMQSLSEAQKLIPNTKKKQETTHKTAEKALEQEIAQSIKTTQNEIKALQKLLAAEEKAK